MSISNSVVLQKIKDQKKQLQLKCYNFINTRKNIKTVKTEEVVPNKVQPTKVQPTKQAEPTNELKKTSDIKQQINKNKDIAKINQDYLNGRGIKTNQNKILNEINSLTQIPASVPKVEESLPKINEMDEINRLNREYLKNQKNQDVSNSIETKPVVNKPVFLIESNNKASKEVTETIDLTPKIKPLSLPTINIRKKLFSRPSLSRPVVEPVVEAVVEVVEPVVEVVEVVEAVVEPVVEAVVEAVVEPVAEPVVEAVVEAVVESKTEPNLPLYFNDISINN